MDAIDIFRITYFIFKVNASAVNKHRR